jgi:hypothetical protein
MTYPAKHISVGIDAPAQTVYAYLSNPLNLPSWAAGLSRSTIKASGDHWIANSPIGDVKVKFVDKNNLGVVDHEVTLPNGEVNYNALRVIRNNNGSEVIFTLYRLPRMNDAEFATDADLIRKDLEALRKILSAPN